MYIYIGVKVGKRRVKIPSTKTLVFGVNLILKLMSFTSYQGKVFNDVKDLMFQMKFSY